MRITTAPSTHSNFMKIASLCHAIDAAKEVGRNIPYRTVHTGPQDDAALDVSLFSDLAVPRLDAYSGVSGCGHSWVTASIMLAPEEELNRHPAQAVLVVDDMTAAMSCTIVVKKRGLKVTHVIVSTRLFDMNISREVNRTTVDATSDYFLTVGMVANRNLNQGGMMPKYIRYVNNILVDIIRYNCHRLMQPLRFSTPGLCRGNHLSFTLNCHDPLEKETASRPLMRTLVVEADSMPVVVPMHPYAERIIKSLGPDMPHLRILPLQGYLHFGFSTNQARGIVTDSGNIAEEVIFLDVPCITLNTYIEHPETQCFGTNGFVGENPTVLSAVFDKLLHDNWKHAILPDRWDGRIAEHIVQTLINGEKI